MQDVPDNTFATLGLPFCSPAEDRAALGALYNATGGASWTNDSGWVTGAPIGQWHGVTTGSGGRVTELRLSQNRLTGPVRAELGSLVNLEELFLSGNRLSGCIPAGLRVVANSDLDQLGLPFCTGAHGAPTISAVTPGMGSLTVAWAAPGRTGGSPIIAYDLRHIDSAATDKSDANWTMVEDIWTTGSGSLNYRITGLTDGTQYDVQVRVVDAASGGPWSATATGTPATW